jgi:hypothetical protein
MRKLGIGLTTLLALLLAACGGDNETAPPYTGFVQPAGTVAVTFTVKDTTNRVFTAGNLQWKGSMIHDSATRKITKDATWGGPWATLYDDGPWISATTSHEGADTLLNPVPTAGDHIWSVTVFVTPPVTGSDTYEYGLNDGSLTACATPGPTCRLLAVDGWIWKGSNGTFAVAAGATAAITATGITFPAFGTNDVRFILDQNALATRPNNCSVTTTRFCTADADCFGKCSVATTTWCTTAANCPTGETCNPTGETCVPPSATWDTSKISVKGSGWGWNEILLFDDGTLGDAAATDGNYTFQLGPYTGAGNLLPHSGLLNAGDKPEFVFVFNGKEYKDASGNCLSTGITAETKAGAGAWTNAAITLNPANKNTWITVP